MLWLKLRLRLISRHSFIGTVPDSCNRSCGCGTSASRKQNAPILFRRLSKCWSNSWQSRFDDFFKVIFHQILWNTEKTRVFWFYFFHKPDLHSKLTTTYRTCKVGTGSILLENCTSYTLQRSPKQVCLHATFVGWREKLPPPAVPVPGSTLTASLDFMHLLIRRERSRSRLFKASVLPCLTSTWRMVAPSATGPICHCHWVKNPPFGSEPSTSWGFLEKLTAAHESLNCARWSLWWLRRKSLVADLCPSNSKTLKTLRAKHQKHVLSAHPGTTLYLTASHFQASHDGGWLHGDIWDDLASNVSEAEL